jgi:uncharacterized protein (TIGR00369 family)
MNEQDNGQTPRAAPEIHVTDIVLPNQTNNFGTMFGGEVMALMDKAAAIAGLRFCRQPLVTASSERIDFRTPIHAGEIIEAIARVIYVGRTSMIVRVHIDASRFECRACCWTMTLRAPSGRWARRFAERSTRGGGDGCYLILDTQNPPP